MLAALVLLLMSCAGEPAEDSAPAPVDTACAGQPEVTWDTFGDGFFAFYCRACHSEGAADRQGAPEGLDFDTAAQVRSQAALIRDAVLVEERMPVGGGVYADDLDKLAIFLDCGP